MKKIHYCLFILLALFTASCSGVGSQTPNNQSNNEANNNSNNENNNESNNGNNNNSTNASNTINVSVSNLQDFSLTSTLNSEKTELTISVVSSIPFSKLSWVFDGNELSETGNQTVVNIISLNKGAYNLLVTGIYNNVVYSAEMIITIN